MSKPKPKSALDRLVKLGLDGFIALTWEPRKKRKWSAWIWVASPRGDNPIGTGRTPQEAAANALKQIEGKG